MITIDSKESGMIRSIIELGHEVYLQSARSRVYRRNEAVFTEGDTADAVHVVKKGTVKMVKQDLSGRDRVLALLGPGDVLGAAEVVTRGTYAASAVARGKLVTIKIPGRRLRELMNQHSTVAGAVNVELARSLLAVQRSVEHLSVGRAPERIASLLLALTERWSMETPGVIPIALTRQEIADMAGVTVETCIRTLSRFKRDGVVDQMPRKTIRIDVDALRMMSGAA